MDSIVSKSSGRIVARGVYEGETGDVTIPEVDMNNASVRLLASAWAVSGGSTGAQKSVAGATGSVYVALINSTTIHISNKVMRVTGSTYPSLVTEYVPVSWEVISYA
tara:strand:+ start:174 stop:494 length:321 start_codon:yes stop_codon:yes gene_type:complete